MPNRCSNHVNTRAHTRTITEIESVTHCLTPLSFSLVIHDRNTIIDPSTSTDAQPLLLWPTGQREHQANPRGRKLGVYRTDTETTAADYETDREQGHLCHISSLKKSMQTGTYKRKAT